MAKNIKLECWSIADATPAILILTNKARVVRFTYANKYLTAIAQHSRLVLRGKKRSEVSKIKRPNGGSTVVEHSPQHPNVEGSFPATTPSSGNGSVL